MTRRERLMAMLQGKPVDRPPISFYEIDGFNQDEKSRDPYHIFTHPSWLPVLTLAREKTDVIARISPVFENTLPNPIDAFSTTEKREENGSLITIQTLQVGNRVLTSRSRRDRDVDTVWTLEHLLKDVDDLDAFLSLPPRQPGNLPETSAILELEERMGDAGIVMLDTPDPLCLAASLFSMEDFTIIALTEPERFHRLLESFASWLLPQTEAIAQALPGRLWRIYGPEYASPPYLPPRLFREYVVQYDKPMVEVIQRDGGFARLHSHGNLKAILDDIVSTGCRGLDPVEPPPQGDVTLKWVREHYGDQLVLFGNLEASDLENLPTTQFVEKVEQALDEGVNENGGGLVLMPSACPYGRVLSPLAVANYQAIIETVERRYAG